MNSVFGTKMFLVLGSNSTPIFLSFFTWRKTLDIDMNDSRPKKKYLVRPAGFFFYSVLHWNFSWTSMPCLLPENLKKSKQLYFWDNNLCEGVVLGKIEKKVRIQSHSSYHKHLIESFETINSVKIGFHHLRSLGVPPVNFKRERKPLQ